MKRIVLLTGAMAAVMPLFAADTNSVDTLKQAIAKLKAEPNYSWTEKVELPTMGFTPEPMQGVAEKDGFMLVKQDMNGNTVQAAFKGGKVAMKLDDAWQSFDSVDTTGFNGWWLGLTKSAGDEAADLVSKAKELKAGADGAWSGELTEAGAAELITFGRRPGATNGPPPAKNASGTVKLWIKDGEVTKFESHLKGLVSFAADQEAQEMETIRTAEIRDQGKTKVEVPAEAKAKLEAK